MTDILLGCKLVRKSEIPALGLGVEAKTNTRQCQIRDSQPNLIYSRTHHPLIQLLIG